MPDFNERLQNAISRGEKSRNDQGTAEGEKKATAEQLRNLHSELRTSLSDHIGNCLKQLCDHFPGFDFSTIVSEDGWGARITRDDINLTAGSSRNLYSRLEVLVKPFSDAHILEVSTKGTIRNKESLNRSNFKFLHEVTEQGMIEVIDGVVLEFAEQYAANG